MSEEKISIELLGRRVATLTDQVADLKLELADLKIRFTTLEQRFGALEQRFAALEQRFSLQEERTSRILAILVRMGRAPRAVARGREAVRCPSAVAVVIRTRHN